jgi:hypothetical protein
MARAGDDSTTTHVIAADDGRILFRHNQTAHARSLSRASGRRPVPTCRRPRPGQAAIVPASDRNAGWLPGAAGRAGLATLQNAPFAATIRGCRRATRTIGNNVEAFADVSEPDGFGPADPNECNVALPVAGDTHACTNASNAFDHVYDTNLAPTANRTQVMAAVTNLFYVNNYLHDWFYDAGFDEASGNAQEDNYGRGGIAGDSIFAEAQDYSGTNNASMSTLRRPRPDAHVPWNSSTALVKVNAPAAIAGAKGAGTAVFGPQAFDVSGDLVLAQDAADEAGPTTTDGCSPFTNAAAVAGRIAAIDRGVCTFVVKVKNAQNAGAAAVDRERRDHGIAMAGSSAMRSGAGRVARRRRRDPARGVGHRLDASARSRACSATGRSTTR